MSFCPFSMSTPKLLSSWPKSVRTTLRHYIVGDLLIPRPDMNDTIAQLSPPFPKGGSGGILLDRGRLKSPLAPLFQRGGPDVLRVLQQDHECLGYVTAPARASFQQEQQ